MLGHTVRLGLEEGLCPIRRARHSKGGLGRVGAGQWPRCGTNGASRTRDSRAAGLRIIEGVVVAGRHSVTRQACATTLEARLSGRLPLRQRFGSNEHG